MYFMGSSTAITLFEIKIVSFLESGNLFPLAPESLWYDNSSD